MLRRVAAERADILLASDPLATDTPPWLAARWTDAYGPVVAAQIAAAHCQEPSIDITVKADATESLGDWADRLGGEVLPTGSIRLSSRTAIRMLPGYAEGAWWVQDAAAALPARLLGDVAGQRVLDLCAAPGGKTAQLASAGAIVTAVDRSAPRMGRLTENMQRLA